MNNENDYLTTVALDAYNEAKSTDGLNIHVLNSLHTAILHRVIGIFLDENAISKSSDLINKIHQLILHEQGKINAKNSLFVEINKHSLILSDNTKILNYFQCPLEFGKLSIADNQNYIITLCNKKEIELMKKIYKKYLYICLDYGKIIGKPIVRFRKNGDKITFPNRGTKSLKKLFIDHKLTAQEKSQVLVLADDSGVVAVMGYGHNQQVACDGQTSEFLIIAKQ